MRSCACLNRTLVFAPPYGKASPKPTGGNLSKRKRWTRVSSGCLTLDAYPLDANRRSGLAKHLRLPERTRASFSLSSSRGALKAEQLLQNQFTQPPSLHYIGG